MGDSITFLSFVLKYGDRYITSQIFVENHLADCFEYLMCQQMSPTAASIPGRLQKFVYKQTKYSK